MKVYKVCTVTTDGSYASVAPPTCASLMYAVGKKTEALRNTPGIFCFSDENSARNFARDVGERVCFIAEVDEKDMKLLSADMNILPSWRLRYDSINEVLVVDCYPDGPWLGLPLNTVLCEAITPISKIAL